MAGAHCAAAVTPTYYHFPAARKVPVLACNVSTQFPSSKPSKRKNHLRPKILKTLTKPFLNPELTPTNPFIIQSPLEQLPPEYTVIESNPVEEQTPEFPSDQFSGEDVKFESNPIEQQPPNFASDRFSVEEVKFESDPIEQLSDLFSGEDVKYTAIESDPIEEKPPEFPSDRFGGEEVKLSELGQQKLELLSGEVGDDFKSVELELEFSSDQLDGEEVKNINLVEMQTEMKEFDLVEQQLELSSCEEIKKSDPIEKLPGFEGESSFSDEKTEVVEMAQVSEFSVSETSFGGLDNGIAGNYFSTAAFEIGLSFLGACVLHIVSTLWMARSIKSGKKDRKRVFDFSRWNQNNKTRLELQSKEKGNVTGESKNGGVVSAHESEMSKKIAQIRELAREARELENLGSKGNDMKEAEEEDEFDDDDDDDDDIGESGIRKEVGDELVKLQKNLRDSSKKSSLSPLWERALRWEGKTEDGFDKDGLAAEEASEALIFKKKYRFKSGVIDAKDANKPQGFMGRRNPGVTEIEMTKEMLRNGNSEADELDLSDKVKQIDLPSVHVPESVSKPSVKDNARKLPAEESKRTGSSGKKVVNGRARAKRGVAKSERGVGLSRNNLSNVEAHSSGAFSLENQYVSPVSKSCNDLNVNGSLKNKEGGIVMANNRVSDAESYIKPEFWWLSLPYVIAIVMRRGHDGQGPKGLFTLRSSSKDSGHSTFTVAFEDHGEATNVCHILDSFFDELGDFSAEAVPVPVKELEEAVKSQTMKLVVVKKGELQLSAGQPLTDVETALHSLIGPS